VQRTERLKRQRTLLWLLEENSPGLTVKELAHHLAVSARSVQRDLMALRGAGYPLCSTAGRWRFVAGQALPSALAVDGANQEPERDRGWLLDRALRQHIPVSVSYCPPGPGGPVRLELAPLVLQYLDGSLFLIAREHPTGPLHTFAVERLAHIALGRGQHFTANHAAAGLEAYLQDQMLQQAQRQLERVTIRLSQAAGWRVHERIWHPTQRVSVEKEGTRLVSFRVPGFAWVKAWVLGLGHQAVVLSPEALVHLVCAELEATRRHYAEACHGAAQLDLYPDET